MDSNIEKMTDDQLHDYIGKLMTKLSIASRLGGGSGAAEQLQRMIFMARHELSDRSMKQQFKQMIATQPAEIITDPDLVPTEELNKKPTKKSKQPINRVQVKRSSYPTSSIDLSPTPDTKDKK